MEEETLIRQEIKRILVGTNGYDGVFLGSTAERKGEAADHTRAVFIEPSDTTSTTDWDAEAQGMVEYTMNLKFTFAARYHDPEERDAIAGQLLSLARSKLAGQSITGTNEPSKTRFVSWRWEPSSSSEREITAVFRIPYLVEGWDTIEEGDA